MRRGGRGSLCARSGCEEDLRLADELRELGGSRSLGPAQAGYELLQGVGEVQAALAGLPFLLLGLLNLSSESLEFTLDADFCVSHGSDLS